MASAGPRRYNLRMNDTELLDLAAGLARRAAAAIEAVKRAGFVVERKTDESPVTEADRIAEALIVEGLREAAPDIPVVAEEEVEAGVAPAVAARARRFWLVDPLDGTKGFARGGDEYAVCIGLVEGGRARLGAIALPATGELFGGLVGADAWKEAGDGERRRTAAPPHPRAAGAGSRNGGAGQPPLRGRPAARALSRGAARGGAARPVLGAEILPRGGGRGRHLRPLRPDHGMGQRRRPGDRGSGGRRGGGPGLRAAPLRQGGLAQPGFRLLRRGMTAATRLLPASAVDEAAALLRGGALVAFPTETVYGLGADATNGRAVAAIFAAKGRPRFNPLICHYADAEAAFADAAPDARARTLAERFWPGPLTLVLPRRPESRVDLLTGAGLDSLGVRVPGHPLALALLRAAGVPLAAPSANPSGAVSPTTAEHVLEGLGGRIAAVLDGGACPVGVESTVLDLTGERAALLRPGGVPAEAIEAVLGGPLLRAAAPGREAPRGPGMLASHYAPTCRCAWARRRRRRTRRCSPSDRRPPRRRFAHLEPVRDRRPRRSGVAPLRRAALARRGGRAPRPARHRRHAGARRRGSAPPSTTGCRGQRRRAKFPSSVAAARSRCPAARG